MNLLLVGTLAAGAAALLFRNTARAGKNLRFEPNMVAIDGKRTKAALFSRVYFKVVLKAINSETSPITITASNLIASYQGRDIGNLEMIQGGTIPARGTRQIEFTASISSFGIVSQIQEIIKRGFKYPLQVRGFIQTNLGRVPVTFEKKIGSSASINGLKKKQNF